MKRVLKEFQHFARSHSNFHRAVRAVWTPPQSVFQHLYFDGQIRVEIEPGVDFCIECRGEEFENDLFWRGYGKGLEGRSLAVWRKMISAADYIADVGANTGIYALSAQALRPRAKILAVEPSPRVFAKLQRNIALNGFPILAVECAASDHEGTAVLHDFPGPHQYSASLEPGMQGTVEIEVRTATLDTLFAVHGFDRIDAIKMDIETHEPRAIRGMLAMIERSRPTMLIEILSSEIERHVREALGGLDYSFTSLASQFDGDSRNFLLQPEPSDVLP